MHQHINSEKSLGESPGGGPPPGHPESKDICQLGALILRMRGGAKHSPHLRTPEIQQKSSNINDFENEPGHP